MCLTDNSFKQIGFGRNFEIFALVLPAENY